MNKDTISKQSSNTLSSRASKRIEKDLKDIKFNDALREQDKIYCYYEEDNKKYVKALIVGPKDTPYEGGFFFFDLEFPDSYPHKPPSAKMKTLSPKESVRFNPNLYVEGKVCLSILGTWSGPGWTVCMNLTTVLTSIQSLMGESPYHNEPGYESADEDTCKQYNDCIDYFTYHVAIIGILKKPPAGFEVFREHFEKVFVRDFEQYKKRLTELKNTMNGKKIVAPSPFSSMRATCDYDRIEKEMNAFYEKLSPKYAKIIADEEEKRLEKNKTTQTSGADKRKNALFG